MSAQSKNQFSPSKKKLWVWGSVIVVVVMSLLYNNLANLFHNTLELRKLKKRSTFLDKEYDELVKVRAKLKAEDLEYIEKIARTQYNLAKPNEIEFRIKQ